MLVLFLPYFLTLSSIAGLRRFRWFLSCSKLNLNTWWRLFFSISATISECFFNGVWIVELTLLLLSTYWFLMSKQPTKLSLSSISNILKLRIMVLSILSVWVSMSIFLPVRYTERSIGTKLIWYLSASTPLTWDMVMSFLFLPPPLLMSLYSMVFCPIDLRLIRIDFDFDI